MVLSAMISIMLFYLLQLHLPIFLLPVDWCLISFSISVA